jgi:hypothetical protein
LTIAVDRLASAPDVELSGLIEIRPPRGGRQWPKDNSGAIRKKKKPKQKKVAPAADIVGGGQSPAVAETGLRQFSPLVPLALV